MPHNPWHFRQQKLPSDKTFRPLFTITFIRLLKLLIFFFYRSRNSLHNIHFANLRFLQQHYARTFIVFIHIYILIQMLPVYYIDPSSTKSCTPTPLTIDPPLSLLILKKQNPFNTSSWFITYYRMRFKALTGSRVRGACNTMGISYFHFFTTSPVWQYFTI